jgi:hypothetical protein
MLLPNVNMPVQALRNCQHPLGNLVAINLEKQESWNRHINEKIVQLFSLQFILYPGILYTGIPETRVLAPYRIMKEERF